MADDDRRTTIVTLVEHALRGVVLEAGADARLAVGLPWFRSMPLSSIVEAVLAVDGEPVEDLAVVLGGATVPVTGLAHLVDRYWFLQDRQVLAWPTPPATRAAAADVVLRLRLHLPFLTGPDGGSVQVLQEVRGTVPIARAA